MLYARKAIPGVRRRTGRALATAFIAKAILNLPTSRDLIRRLRVDEGLWNLCGWRSRSAVPHESKFLRVFAAFSETQLPQQLHEAVIAVTQQNRLIGHIARDSTAIAVRERFPETVK